MSSLRTDPKDFGLRLAHLAGGQIGWSMTRLTQNRAQRFCKFQQQVLAVQSPSAALLAARMVALDAISPQSLHLIEQQGAKPYRLAGTIAIEWLASEPVRIERRLLSPKTVLAWPMQIGANALSAVVGLAAALGDWLSSHPLYESTDRSIETIEGDQLCWLLAPTEN